MAAPLPPTPLYLPFECRGQGTTSQMTGPYISLQALESREFLGGRGLPNPRPSWAGADVSKDSVRQYHHHAAAQRISGVDCDGEAAFLRPCPDRCGLSSHCEDGQNCNAKAIGGLGHGDQQRARHEVGTGEDEAQERQSDPDPAQEGDPPELRDEALQRAGDESVLRSHLEGLLPAPMVPSRFQPFATLPLTATGKVDRRRLAERVSGEADATAPRPQTAVPVRRRPQPAPEASEAKSLEDRLAAIWAKLLGIPRVRPDENFFELGGHSLLMVRVQNEIRKQFDHEVGIVELFRFPTVATLARHLAAHVTSSAGAPASVKSPPPQVADDQMIHQFDAHDLAGITHSTGELVVVGRWRRVAARVRMK